MNKYETVMIVDDTLSQQKKDETIDKILQFIIKNGVAHEKKVLGSRKLAYQIKNNTTGYYCVIKFEANPSMIAELERIYRITDEILKFIVVREDD